MKILILSIFISFNLFASLNYSLLNNVKSNKYNYLKFAKNLVDNKMYMSAVPFLKEYIAKGGSRNKKLLDYLVDTVIDQVGVRQFEVLPFSILDQISTPVIHYIKARKYFRKGKLNRSLKELSGTIGNNHLVKPFALLLEGTIHSMKGRHKSARKSFESCRNKSNQNLRKAKNNRKKRQLKINLENCLAGIARDYFSYGKYVKAQSAYLDIDKNSFIWPELLFEEAWNSFYLKDYNRTLGKLVTYKAPILSFIFNPEIHILRAMTYLKLCLWSDMNKVVDNFYTKYERQSELLNRFIQSKGKNYRYYYLLANSRLHGKKRGGYIINKIINKIIKDPSFIEIYDGLVIAKKEVNYFKNSKRTRSSKVVLNILKDAVLLQQNLIGAYVRKEFLIARAQLNKAFEGMSFIKLSILSKRKNDIYSGVESVSRVRGDIKYLQRTEKQYFWSFNGEFWADELGDYVFTLRSECGEK